MIYRNKDTTEDITWCDSCSACSQKNDKRQPVRPMYILTISLRISTHVRLCDECASSLQYVGRKFNL